MDQINKHQNKFYQCRELLKVTTEFLPPEMKKRILTFYHNTGNHFDKIGDEVLLYIMSYFTPKDLTKIRLVCKRWRDVGSDKSLYRKIDFSCADNNRRIVSNWKTNTDHKLELLAEKGYCIRELTLCGHKNLTNHGIINIIDCCKYLKEINLADTNINDKTIHLLAKFCKHLKIIDVRQARELQTISLIYFRQMDKLEELYIEGTRIPRYKIEQYNLKPTLYIDLLHQN